MRWYADRRRLFAYLREPRTFIFPFVDADAKQVTAFAVQGKHRNPYRYRSSILRAHLKDMKYIATKVAALVFDFFAWRWPYVSASTLVMWQVMVSYPTLIPACLSMIMSIALLRGYATVSSRSAHPLQQRMTLPQLMAILCVGANTEAINLAPDGEDESDDESIFGGDQSEPSEDTDEDEDETKRRGTAGKDVHTAVTPPAKGVAPKTYVESESVYDELPTWFPKAGSLQEEMDKIRAEVEEDIRAEFAPDPGFSLNPLAPILGQIQGMLNDVNVRLRLVWRILSWRDRLVTLHVTIAFVILSIALTGIGLLLALLPWGVIFEWIFRAVGIAAFGPHMIWVCRSYCLRWHQFQEQSKAFDEGDHATRAAMLEEHRRACEREIRQLVQMEMHGKLPPPEVCQLHDNVAKSFKTMTVRPRPNAAQLRFLHKSYRSRTWAYPSFPSEDRPTLERFCSRDSTHKLDTWLDA